MKTKIKEQVFEQFEKDYEMTIADDDRVEKAIDLTLAKVGEEIDNSTYDVYYDPIQENSEADKSKDGNWIDAEELKQKLGIK